MGDLGDRLVPKLDLLRDQFHDLERQLADPEVVADHHALRALSIKRSSLAGLVERYEQYQRCQRDLEEAREILHADEDEELSELARQQLPPLTSEAERLMEGIASELVTADDRAVGAVILEIRAASGGAEAALWAGDLAEMYHRFAVRCGFRETPLDFSPLYHGLSQWRGHSRPVFWPSGPRSEGAH